MLLLKKIRQKHCIGRQILNQPALVVIFLFCILFSAEAQTRRPAAASKTSPKPPEVVPTFDSLIADESFRVYGEVRGLGQFIGSAGLKDLLEPVIKLADPPKEFRTLVKWLNTHADEVVSSRLMCASLPLRPKLPQFICALEFASEQEARDFEPKLRGFLPRIIPPPGVNPSPSPAVRSSAPANPKAEKPVEPPPPYVIKHAGSLVLISATPIEFKTLRPPRSKLLSESQNFRMVRDRFNSDPVFLYFDLNSIDLTRPEAAPTPDVHGPEQKREEEVEEDAQSPEEVVDQNVPPPPAPVETPATDPSSQNLPQPEVLGTRVVIQEAEPNKSQQQSSLALGSMFGALFSGPPSWPQAVGAAVVFDGDAYAVRVLMVNEAEKKNVSIPIVPHLISGPPIVPAAPSVLPADTELVLTLSLDYAQIYDGMLKTLTQQSEAIRARSRQQGPPPASESPLNTYERLLGVNFEKELIPLLGNEIALSLPLRTLTGTAPQPQTEPGVEDDSQPKSPPKVPSPLMAISIRDREAVRALVPKIFESLGLKGAALLAQTQRRENTELVTYAGVFAYAFIDDFMLISTDAAAATHAVDSYLERQTLASDSYFRNATRWQPRQVLGQLYISKALMQSDNFIQDVNSITDQTMRDFLMSIGPSAEPVTYALSNEGMGPLHELHLPRNLVMLVIASISGQSALAGIAGNEAQAQSALRAIGSAQATFKATKGDGRFASLTELIDEGLLSASSVQQRGYRVEVVVSGTGFEARAIPQEYGKTGKLSFFLDESTILRAGDHGGGPATVADKPLGQ